MVLGKIYKIVNTVNDDIYIGSTEKKYLSIRMAKHRCLYKKWKNGADTFCASLMMFDEVGLGNCKIILIEDYEFIEKKHLRMREQFHMDTNICINIQRAHTPIEIRKEQDKEYYQANKERLSKYQKQFYQENKEHIIEYQKQYNQENKDKIKEQKKEYREDNKERIKLYREVNREEKNRKQREKYAIKKQLLNNQ
jgi:hypothetical protein